MFRMFRSNSERQAEVEWPTTPEGLDEFAKPRLAEMARLLHELVRAHAHVQTGGMMNISVGTGEREDQVIAHLGVVIDPRSALEWRRRCLDFDDIRAAGVETTVSEHMWWDNEEAPL